MSMRTGLLLLQSISPCALRSGRRGCTTGRRWSTAESTSTARGTRTSISHALAALAVCSGGSALAMCSSDNGGNNDHGAMVVANRAPANTAAVVAATSNQKFDEPEKKPYHNPLLPFPESALKHDTYNGVTLDLTSIVAHAALDAETFSDRMGTALAIWTAERKKGIWLKIPTAHAHLIAPATTHGFDFQHAEAGYCVLTRWPPTTTPSRLPVGPTHQVGVGALVLHPATGEMLAVQELSGPAAKRKLWKMPTGLTDPGEDIAAAAVRELREETGLECTFERIVCFRQAHGGLFNRSDMFFVCLCRLAPEYEARLRNGEGEVELLPQEEEILEARWIPMSDYANQLTWKESPFYQEMNAAMMRAAQGVYGGGEEESHGFVGKHLPVGYRPGSETIYVSSKL